MVIGIIQLGDDAGHIARKLASRGYQLGIIQDSAPSVVLRGIAAELGIPLTQSKFEAIDAAGVILTNYRDPTALHTLIASLASPRRLGRIFLNLHQIDGETSQAIQNTIAPTASSFICGAFLDGNPSPYFGDPQVTDSLGNLPRALAE